MSFQYYTRPLAGMNRYTGQPSFRGLHRTEDVVAALVQRSGLSATQVETLLRQLGEFVIDESMNGMRIEPLFGLLGFGATCGGSQQQQDFAPTFDNLSMDIRLRIGPEGNFRARQAFSAECLGHRSLVVPTIVRATNMHNGLTCCYTPGKPLQVELEHGRGTLNPTITSQGIFFESATGTRVRSTDYAYNKGSIICCTVPTGLTGVQQLSVSLWLNNALRTAIYDLPLNPVAATAKAKRSKSTGRSAQRPAKATAKGLVLPA